MQPSSSEIFGGDILKFAWVLVSIVVSTEAYAQVVSPNQQPLSPRAQPNARAAQADTPRAHRRRRATPPIVSRSTEILRRVQRHGHAMLDRFCSNSRTDAFAAQDPSTDVSYCFFVRDLTLASDPASRTHAYRRALEMFAQRYNLPFGSVASSLSGPAAVSQLWASAQALCQAAVGDCSSFTPSEAERRQVDLHDEDNALGRFIGNVIATAWQSRSPQFHAFVEGVDPSFEREDYLARIEILLAESQRRLAEQDAQHAAVTRVLGRGQQEETETADSAAPAQSAGTTGAAQ
jgi:hypothetical protein